MLAGMVVGRLDPSPWNLGAPLLALAACGPLVPFDGTATEGATTEAGEGPNPSGTNPSGPNPTGPNPTGPNPTSATTSSPQCTYDSDCPYGWSCNAGYCYYDGYCGTCCEGECGNYYECFGNAECPTGYVCQYYYCQQIPMESECWLVALDFQIPVAAGGDVRSLAFVDGNGDAQRDLVVGQAGPLQYVDGATLSVTEIVDTLNAEDIATGDLDGDGDGDILVADGALGGGMRIVQNDGAWTTWVVPNSDFDLDGVDIGDVEADGFPDLWGYSDTNGTLFVSNPGGWMFGEPFFVLDASTSLAVGNVDGDDFADTAVYSYQPYVLLQGAAFNAYGLWDGSSRAERIVTLGNFNGNGADDLVTLQSVNGVTITTSWSDPVIESQPFHTWWQYPASEAVSVDMNGDGYVDIVAAAAGYPITIAYGAPEAPPDVVNCVQYVNSPISAATLAVGDMTGDGRSDIAISDGVSVTVLAQSG